MSPVLPDAAAFRAVMGRFATGVTVVTYLRDGVAAGMTANAFLSVSLDPQLILVSVRDPSRFCDSVQVGDCYGVNFLAERQQHIGAHYGGRAVEGLDVPIVHERGVPLVAGSIAHIVARVVDIHPAGDHKLFIASVEHLVDNVREQAEPLLYYAGRYGRLHQPAQAVRQAA